MSNGSTVENRSANDKLKNKSRFQGVEGQNQGNCKSGPNQWIPKISGLFAFPVSNSKAET